MDYLKKTTTLCKHSQSHNHIESYSEENSNYIKNSNLYFNYDYMYILSMNTLKSCLYLNIPCTLCMKILLV